MAVCQKLGLGLGKNPDIGLIVGPANKIGNIGLESAIFKLETGNFYTDFLIGLSCKVSSFMAVRQKLHLVRRNHTFEVRIAEMVNCAVNPAGSRYFWEKMKKKKFFVLIQWFNSMKKIRKRKKKKIDRNQRHPSPIQFLTTPNHASLSVHEKLFNWTFFSPFLAPNLRVTTADGA